MAHGRRTVAAPCGRVCVSVCVCVGVFVCAREDESCELIQCQLQRRKYSANRRPTSLRGGESRALRTCPIERSCPAGIYTRRGSCRDQMVDVSGGDKVALGADARPCGPSVLAMLAQARPAAARRRSTLQRWLTWWGQIWSHEVSEWPAAPPLMSSTVIDSAAGLGSVFSTLDRNRSCAARGLIGGFLPQLSL